MFIKNIFFIINIKTEDCHYIHSSHDSPQFSSATFSPNNQTSFPGLSTSHIAFIDFSSSVELLDLSHAQKVSRVDLLFLLVFFPS